MRNCLFAYKPLNVNEKNYSLEGLKKLSRKLTHLEIFPYNQSEQIEIARKMVKKISIKGVQPKFNVILSEKERVDWNNLVMFPIYLHGES